jgi:translation initiation factor 1
MNEICPKCGLQKELCICGEIAKESQKIKVRILNRRFGKYVTVISGFDKSADVKELGKTFKKKLACGGTVKGDEIELQGKHRGKAKEILMAEGFKEELIDA